VPRSRTYDDDFGVFVREFSLMSNLPTSSPEQELSTAVSERQLRLVFQPVVRLDDRSVVSHEALVRRLHPTRGLLTAAELIPGNDDQVLDLLSDWVFTHACRAQARARPGACAMISVNVADAELGRGTLAGRIATALSKTGLDSDHLTVEIPAHALSGAHAQATREIKVIQATGVTVAADGARPGVTKARERNVVDLLKLHPDGVQPATGTTASAWSRLVKGARDKGMHVVAKGIESDEHLARALHLGCDLGQGNLLGRPARDMR
jgi:EAL domain-containing protein (putative c-di-GMP-specific phosphodiesterase class I)